MMVNLGAAVNVIQDIHHKMLQKDRRLALQVDVTATPRHNNGAIFVQTVSDYPLVEAIHQNVVKHPVLPDAASRAKLQERKSALFTEKYADYLALGIEEWKKSYAEHHAVHRPRPRVRRANRRDPGCTAHPVHGRRNHHRTLGLQRNVVAVATS